MSMILQVIKAITIESLILNVLHNKSKNKISLIDKVSKQYKQVLQYSKQLVET